MNCGWVKGSGGVVGSELSIVCRKGMLEARARGGERSPRGLRRRKGLRDQRAWW